MKKIFVLVIIFMVIGLATVSAEGVQEPSKSKGKSKGFWGTPATTPTTQTATVQNGNNMAVSSNISGSEGSTAVYGNPSDAEINYMLSEEYKKAVRQEFYKLLDIHRMAHKLETFPGTINVDLEEYADLRAAEQKTHFGHTRPDGGNAASGWNNSKTTPKRRYTSECAASVIILHPDPVTTANIFFAAWKSSPAHNNIMLTPFSSDYKYEYVLGIAPEYYINAFGIPGVRSGAVFAVGQWY